MLRRRQITDTQWAKIEPLLPGREGDPGRHGDDNRLFVDAVLYVAHTGIPWRDLPERFGKWNSVWHRFDRWCAAEVWVELAQVLGDADLEELHLDSTSVKAQHSAAGARRQAGEKKEEADRRRCLGRSRGGWTTQIHAAVDGRGRPLRLTLTPGQAGDTPQARGLLEGLRPGRLVADAGYDGDALREQVRQLGGQACIRPNPTRKVKMTYDPERYKHRNVIERFFGAIKRFRRVATRYDKKPQNFLGFAWLAAILVGGL